MKKILFILILILLNTPHTFAENLDEVNLEFDETFTQHTLNIQDTSSKSTNKISDRVAINETDLENLSEHNKFRPLRKFPNRQANVSDFSAE